MASLAIIMGIATAFNILVIFKKLELQRYSDATFDGIFLVTLTAVMGGSLGGMMVATVASAIISIYFMFYPPTFTKMFNSDDSDEPYDKISQELSIADQAIAKRQRELQTLSANFEV